MIYFTSKDLRPSLLWSSLQAEYLEDSNSGASQTQSEPELIELPPDESGEKKYKCSFCPNKEFKKRPEVNIISGLGPL